MNKKNSWVDNKKPATLLSSAGDVRDNFVFFYTEKKID